MNKATGLVTYVKGKIGKPYLYGFKQNKDWNKKCTLSDYNSLKRMYGKLIWDSDKSKCVGKYPCDCSGLISAYTGVQRSSTDYRNTATKVLPISKITDAQPGCLLWKQGHIGVLISVGKKSDGTDSYYIAEDGSAYGCQKKPVNWNNWTHILWCKDLEYEKIKKPTTVKKATETKKSAFKQYKAIITKNGVMVREKPAVRSKTKVVKRLSKGEVVNIIEEKIVDGKKYGQLKKSKNWIRLKNTKKI